MTSCVPTETEIPIVVEPTDVPMEETADGMIADSTFEPDELSVPWRLPLSWKIQSAIPHTVTADDGTFNSGSLEGDDPDEEVVEGEFTDL